MKYKTVKAVNEDLNLALADLEDRVNDMFENGWIVTGGIAIHVVSMVSIDGSTNRAIVCQAMIKQ